MDLGLTEQIQVAVRTGLELGAPDYKSGALKARLFLAFAKKKKTKNKNKNTLKKQKTKHNTKNKNRKKEHELTNFFTQFKEKLISREIALGVGNLQASHCALSFDFLRLF